MRVFGWIGLVALCALNTPARAGDLDGVGRRHGLQLDTSRQTPKNLNGKFIECTPLASYARALVRDVVGPQIERYPTKFFRNQRIQKIIFCQKLKENRRSLSGMAIRSQGVFYLAFGDYGGVQTEHMKRVVHHEIYHLIDKGRDAQWRKHNRGMGGRDGYISAYAKTAPAEDRAELYAYLVTSPRAVEDKAAENRALAAKVRDLKDEIRGSHPKLARNLGL